MKKTILLLEDDENLNRGITMRLEKEGYHVLSAFGILLVYRSGCREGEKCRRTTSWNSRRTGLCL